MSLADDVAVVAIGRNEGARLVACLASLQGRVNRIIYVDSGSTDDSVAAARAAGAEVVELDMTVPFTAARARNAGFAALAEAPTPFVQFVDGDCALDPAWLSAAYAHLQAHSKLGIVTGWRSEIHPDASIYNAMCDHEWRRPAGPIEACGGDMMVRTEAFTAAGGFDPKVIAAEDDEFCIRVGHAGWDLERLPLEMTRHDADMHTFGQWWRRAVRAGHGYAQVGDLHEDYFVQNRKRTWIYGLALPCAVLVAASIAWWLGLLVAGIYGVNFWRTYQGVVAEGRPPEVARPLAGFLTLAKFPNLLGMLTFYIRQMRKSEFKIIEYK